MRINKRRRSSVVVVFCSLVWCILVCTVFGAEESDQTMEGSGVGVGEPQPIIRHVNRTTASMV